MLTRTISLYKNLRFLSEIISHAVWLYHRFSLSFREVEELLAERGVTVSHEAVRLWCLKFGHTSAKKVRRRRGQPGDTWHLGELFICSNTSNAFFPSTAPSIISFGLDAIS